MLRAGAMQVCITPPIGVELAGYGPRLGRRSTDIHDDLMAQALVLDDGTSRYALVTTDLIAVTRAFARAVRADVARRTRIPGDHVIVTAIHSHTAPTTGAFRDWGEVDRGYVRSAARLVAGAVVAADGKLQPARLSAAAGHHPRLAWNRTGSTLVDDTVEVVQVAGEDGAPLALLVNYACHPVMLGPKPIISADYPGAMRRALRERFPGAVVLFANGACGDIDPITNSAVWGQGTFEDVDREGGALAATVAEMLSRAEALPDARIASRVGAVRLEYDVPSLDTVRERIARYTAEARHLGGRAEDFKEVTGEVKMPRFWLRFYRALEARLVGGTQPGAIDLELQALLLGDALALVAIPAEVYTEQGLAIRRASRFAHTLIAAYANGANGYLPPRAEYAKGAYTAVLAAAVHDAVPYQPGVAERMADAVMDLLR